MGEHSNPEEPWRTTAARALREELGLGVADDDAGLVNLAPGTSYLVKVAYDDVARRDLQATALFFYRIPSDAKLQLDDGRGHALGRAARAQEIGVLRRRDHGAGARGGGADPSSSWGAGGFVIM